MVRFISVSGNIGAGKSTLIHNIKDAIPNCHVMPERLHVWNHDDILSRYYADKKANFEEMQTRIVVDYGKVLSMIPDDGVYIMERCHLDALMVFCTVCKKNGEATDAAIRRITKIVDAYRMPHTVIYLNTDVDTCVKRIQKRGRAGESMISRAYLEQLHDAHRDMVSTLTKDGVDVRVIDNNDAATVLKHVIPGQAAVL